MAEQYYEGIGRRKASTARVRVMNGSGEFVVNEKGRQNVIEKKQKNVHAYIKAKNVYVPAMNLWCAEDICLNKGYELVSYNPYEAPHFFIVETGEPIYKARHVVCIAGKVYVKQKVNKFKFKEDGYDIS